MSARYMLAGDRAGFDLAGLTRIDRQPNARGYRYSEFRRRDGWVQAVIATWLLANPPRHTLDPAISSP